MRGSADQVTVVGDSDRPCLDERECELRLTQQQCLHRRTIDGLVFSPSPTSLPKRKGWGFTFEDVTGLFAGLRVFGALRPLNELEEIIPLRGPTRSQDGTSCLINSRAADMGRA